MTKVVVVDEEIDEENFFVFHLFPETSGQQLNSIFLDIETITTRMFISWFPLESLAKHFVFLGDESNLSEDEVTLQSYNLNCHAQQATSTPAHRPHAP